MVDAGAAVPGIPGLPGPRRAALAGLAALGLLGVLMSAGAVAGGAAAWWMTAVQALAAGVCATAALRRRGPERVAWMLLAAALVTWVAGDVVYQLLGSWGSGGDGVPRLADLLWLSFYPLTYAALGFLARSPARGAPAFVWVDGAIVAMATAGVGAMLLGWIVAAGAWGGAVTTALDLAYPLGDVVLLGLVTASFALAGWPPPRRMMVFALALLANVAADVAYLAGIVRGTWQDGGPVDLLWPLAMLLLAVAATMPARVAPRPAPGPAHRLVVPMLAGVAAIGVVTLHELGHAGAAAEVLALLALAAFVARAAFVAAADRRALRGALEAASDELVRRHEALEREMAERHRLELELRHRQELEAIGRLTAGAAHEINTPIQFVGDSVAFLDEAFADLMAALERSWALAEAAACGPPDPGLAGRLRELERESDVEYLVDEVPRAVARAREGAGRVAEVVRAMRELAAPPDATPEASDVNRAVRSALALAGAELDRVAEVHVDLDPGLRPVVCEAADVSRLVLGVLLDACNAMAGRRGRGRVRVTTRARGATAEIRVADDGRGDARCPVDAAWGRHGGSAAAAQAPGGGRIVTVRLPAGPKGGAS